MLSALGIVASGKRNLSGPIVSDTFTRANGAIGNAETGQAWVVSGGQTWSVVSNKAQRTAGTDSTAALPVLVDAGITDMKVTLTPSDYNFSNLWMRATGQLGYRVEWSLGGTIYVERCTSAGAFPVVAQSASGVLSTSLPVTGRVTTPDASTVRVEIIQSGATIFTANDTAGNRITTGTRAGFSSFNSVTYDNFTVEAA